MGNFVIYQQMVVDVFTDPVSGKSYLYWGNGYMAGAELNDDMVSIKKETLKVSEPIWMLRWTSETIITEDKIRFFREFSLQVNTQIR